MINGQNDSEGIGHGVVIAGSHDEFVAAVKGLLENPLSSDDRSGISESVRHEDWAMKTGLLVDIVRQAGATVVRHAKHRLRYIPYPPTSLPIRDLFVLDHVPFDRDTRVMEIGVGCGETCARLAGDCAEITGVDIAGPVLDSLDYLPSRIPNLRLVCADVTGDVNLGRTFDCIVSCDTLEHVSDPVAFFRFVREHLEPGGTAHILFPNELSGAMHGVTRFSSGNELAVAVGDSFERAQVFRADLRPWPRMLVGLFHGRPFRRPRRAPERDIGPQRFDETRFFRRMALWKKLSPIINLYWFVMLRLCRLGGATYKLRPMRTGDYNENCSVYVRLMRNPDVV